MEHSRADLLALAGSVPPEILDWQPHAQSFSIRRLLRHIGNAEEWYVSRVVPPETLPPEWENDAEHAHDIREAVAALATQASARAAKSWRKRAKRAI